MSMELDPIYTLVGGRIRDEREALLVNQDALGLAVGLARTSIVNIEAGRQRVQLDTLARIANVLGVELDSLLRERMLPLFQDSASSGNSAQVVSREAHTNYERTARCGEESSFAGNLESLASIERSHAQANHGAEVALAE